ncbi:MAG: 16S rRNA (cytidine(1402)-2'-O)-methyltransferase [Pseudomonadota bacterium]
MKAHQAVSTTPGTLWVVATPIGNLGDLSPRAGEVLGHVDRIAAEDTRHSAALLAHLGLRTPLVSLHEHNERERVAALVEVLQQGQSIALVSDAGTPLVSDPGFRLVRAARAAGLPVRSVPGPSAPLAALAVAGLPSDRFCFEGFLPHAAGARGRRLDELLARTVTVIVFESAHRIAAAAADLAQRAPEREVFLGRELTKQFEEHFRGAAGGLPGWLAADSHRLRGEFVLILAPASQDPDVQELLTPEQDRLLSALLEDLPVKRAARLVADVSGVARNRVYARALELKKASD